MALALEAKKRETLGTGSARALRNEQRIPVVIYGEGKEAIHASVPAKEVTLNFNKRGFKSTIIEITLDGKKINTLAREVQTNVVTDKPEHLDLQIISDKKPTNIFIPVNITGQAKSPGVKRGGILNVIRREIEFFCQPGKIPAQIEIDVSNLEIGRSIHIEDIQLPEGIAPVIKRNFTLVTIVGKGSDDDAAATTAAAAGAPAAAGAAAPAAGAAAPAAGAAAPKK